MVLPHSILSKCFVILIFIPGLLMLLLSTKRLSRRISRAIEVNHTSKIKVYNFSGNLYNFLQERFRLSKFYQKAGDNTQPRSTRRCPGDIDLREIQHTVSNNRLRCEGANQASFRLFLLSRKHVHVMFVHGLTSTGIKSERLSSRLRKGAVFRCIKLTLKEATNYGTTSKTLTAVFFGKPPRVVMTLEFKRMYLSKRMRLGCPTTT